jgi:hypothetical protein
MNGKPSILFIAKEYKDFELFRSFLQEANTGYSAQYAPTSAEAFISLETSSQDHYPPLIILYLNKPKADITDSIQWLRFGSEYVHIPVAILYSLSNKKQIDALREERFYLHELTGSPNEMHLIVLKVIEILDGEKRKSNRNPAHF